MTTVPALWTCDQGVCAVATGECVNSETCTNETQATDCLDGFTCYGQRCVSAEDFCDTLTCDRGVCSYVEKACANPDSCVMDVDCLGGFFCDDGTCTQNICDADMISCARGVCEGNTGECVNAETCTIGTECLDNHYCVDGACQDVDTACAACTGNQECQYDQNTTVTCVEADSCDNSLDCLGDRICDAGVCAEAGACVNDALEPFDGSTPVAIADGAGFTSATICGADEDGFSYDTTTAVNFTGVLTVVVRAVPEHVGRGELTLDLKDAAGTSVASGTTVNGQARLTKTIGNLDGGVYTLFVTGDAISAAGIDYSVSMNLLDATTVAVCEAPNVLAATQTGNTLSGASLGLAPSCAASGSPAEDVYMFDVTEESVVTLTLMPTNGVDLVLSVRTACEVDLSELACLNDSAGQEKYTGRPSPGRYFAVIQGAAANNGGEYTLTYTAEIPVCSPADNTCADLNVAQVCNAAGTGFDMVTCSEGCDVALGRCARAESDVCYTAIDASGGYTGVIDWDSLTNDYTPGNACVPGLDTTDGPDASFFVNVPPMSALNVELVSNNYDDMSLYLVRDCDDVEQTCFGGVDASGTETLTYVNTKTTAESFFIIADVEDYSFLGTADITISIDAVICTPTVATCTAAVEETCNASGTAYITKNCAFGCDTNGTACALPTNDVCGPGAVDISAGGTFAIDTTDYNNNYDLPGSGCTGFKTAGNDAVYQLSGQPGDVVDVTLTAGFDSALYVLTDCADFNSCLDGSDSGNPESIQFVLADTNPVYVIADSYSSGKGAATLEVTIRTPDCTTPGEAVACIDATSLEYCGSDGFLATYTCGGGCANGACATPSGDVCWDAIPILSGGVATGNFQNLTNNLDPSDSCILSSNPSQDGGDAIYTITLLPGETLVADLTTTSTTAGMYVLTSCDDTTCEYGVSQTKNLEYYSATGGNYFLVVDNTSTSTSSYPFTLNVSTRFGDVCQPGGATCDLAGNLTICADDGLSTVGTVTCPNGCSAGFCNPPAATNDTCATAMAISSDIRLRQSFGDLTGDYNPGATGCTARSMGGPDAVYAITLAPGQTVEAKVQSFDTGNIPSVYFVSDCSDVTNTCLSGKSGIGDRATFGYYSAAGETVYMVVDTQYSTSDAFVLDVTFKPAECTPGELLCSGPETLSTCNSYGLYFETPCYFGCAAGACNPVTNNTCGAGALDVSAGGTFLVDTTLYTNDYNLPSSGCTGYKTDGNDAVFQVSGQPGDVVDVVLDAPYDSALYALTDCSNLNSCVAGSDKRNPETIRFTLTDTNPVYVVADAFSTGQGLATLTVTVRTPDCTNYGQANACVGANSLEYCDMDGFTQTYACAGGCAGGACVTPTGDVCWDAIPILSGGSATGSFGDFENNLDPGASCILSTNPSQDGGDAIYTISLAPGETLVADLVTTSSTAGMYVLTSCSNTACEYGVSPSKHLEYYSATGGTYFLVVDNTSTTTSAFTLNVTTQMGNVCQPGGATCDGSGNLTICADDGKSMLGMASCPNGCSAGYCEPPAVPNTACVSAMPITSDIRLRHSFGALTANYNPSASGCTGNNLIGPESVYLITLEPGETVEASVVSFDTSNAPAIYFVTDCSDVTTTCLAGKAGTGNRADFGYYSATGETVYMIVDTQYASPDTFVLDIAFKSTDCTPNSVTCSDADTQSTCNSYHTYDDTHCYFGCTAGACNPPTNDGCGAGALDVSAGGVFQFDTNLYANDYNLPSSGCAGSSSAGNDAVFQVSGQPGDIVNVELNASFDSVLYVLADCSDFASCLAGSDSGNPESIRFVLTDTNPVYIVADGYSASSKGTGTLTVSVRTPDCTNFGQALACIDADNLQYCDDEGFLSTYACDGGCLGAACGTPSGEVCLDAIPILASGTIQLNTSTYSNSYELSSSHCTGYSTRGNDVVYSYSGQVGETLDVTLTAGYDSALYALTDCSDFTSCLDGSDSGNPETIQFVLTSTDPVYIVADAFSSGNGPATLSVVVTAP